MIDKTVNQMFSISLGSSLGWKGQFGCYKANHIASCHQGSKGILNWIVFGSKCLIKTTLIKCRTYFWRASLVQPWYLLERKRESTFKTDYRHGRNLKRGKKITCFLTKYLSKAHSEPNQTSKMEHTGRKVNGWKSLTFLDKAPS